LSEKIIDINVDIGEGYGRYEIGNDEEIIKWATSANVAAGFHAGDPNTIARTVKYAKKYGVAVGVHPSFQDLRGFGRRVINISGEDLKNDLLYQIGAVDGFVRKEGMELQHVKLHGALYTLANENDEYAEVFSELINEYNAELIVITEHNTTLERKCKEKGIRVANEAFPDLNYDKEGKIVIEKVKKTWDPVTVAKRAIKIAKEDIIVSETNVELHPNAETICIHSDAPNSAEIIKTVRESLEKNGIKCSNLRAHKVA
jgi:UPF0271 protein